MRTQLLITALALAASPLAAQTRQLTAADYARFMEMMLSGGVLGGVRLLGPKTVRLMTSDHLGSIPVAGELLAPGHGFGLGFFVGSMGGLLSLAIALGMIRAKAPDVGTKPGADKDPIPVTDLGRKGAKKGKGALFRVDKDGRLEQLHALTATYFTSVAVSPAAVSAPAQATHSPRATFASR